MSWRNLQIIVSPRGSCKNSFKDSTDCQNLSCCGSVFPKTILILPKNFLNFGFDVVEKQRMIKLWGYGSEDYTSVVLGNSEVTFLGERADTAFCPHVYCVLLYTALQYWNSPSSNFLVFHGGISSRPTAFLFFIFVSTASSSSWVNYPSLISSRLSIIFVIGLCITLRDFPSRFLKCSFHMCVRSSWPADFSFALEVLFFLLTSFTVCHTIRDFLSSREFLILLI